MFAKQSVARREVLKIAGVGAMALFGTSCGYLLYPERKGRSSGSIDAGVLIVDLLWLLPGLVPGIICLAVDYSTGCIYRGGSSFGERAPGDERWPENFPGNAVVALDGVLVAKSAVARDRKGRLELVWDQDVAAEAIRSRGKLIFKRSNGTTAVADVRDLI